MAQTLSIEEQARQEIDDEMAQAIAEIAAEMGPAPGSKTVPEARKLTLWGQRDPSVDYDAMVQTLQTTGVDRSLLDPESDTSLLIVREQPEIARYYAEPVAPEVAEVLAVLAEHPFRLSVLAPLVDDPEALVKESDRLDHQWQKQFGKDQSPPDPEGAPAPVAPQPPTMDGSAAASPAPSMQMVGG